MQTTKDTNGIVEIICEDPDEFWKELSPQKFRWNKYLFRGQRETSWDLRPSALRSKSPYKMLSKEISLPSELTPYQLQVHLEYQALRSFLDGCDSTALLVPGYSIGTVDLLSNPQYYAENCGNFGAWPPDNLLDMIALAQHHGLPTQLLDWTLRSYIAAFFAAYDVIKSSKRTGNFAVWVLEPSLMCPKEQFRVVALPSGVNKNIAAQHGVFTRLKAIFSTKNRTSPVECLAEYLSKNNSTLLRKFCLPKTHAATILDYCESFGITAATIQPSYYGATDYALTHLSKHVFNKNRSRKKSSMK